MSSQLQQYDRLKKEKKPFYDTMTEMFCSYAFRLWGGKMLGQTISMNCQERWNIFVIDFILTFSTFSNSSLNNVTTIKFKQILKGGTIGVWGIEENCCQFQL